MRFGARAPTSLTARAPASAYLRLGLRRSADGATQSGRRSRLFASKRSAPLTVQGVAVKMRMLHPNREHFERRVASGSSRGLNSLPAKAGTHLSDSWCGSPAGDGWGFFLFADRHRSGSPAMLSLLLYGST